MARFANGDEAGVLVVGVEEKQGRITRLRPASLTYLNAEQHQDVIDTRVFPPVGNLEIQAVTLEDGKGILFIHVPRQAEETKPFLVHGAIVGDRVEGAYISIVRRRGEGSIPVSGPAIHSMLAAGRALLQGSAQAGAARTPEADR